MTLHLADDRTSILALRHLYVNEWGFMSCVVFSHAYEQTRRKQCNCQTGSMLRVLYFYSSAVHYDSAQFFQRGARDLVSAANILMVDPRDLTRYSPGTKGVAD